MQIYMNKYTYNYSDDGSIKNAEVGLYGNDSDGQYLSASLVINSDELGKDKDGNAKTFDDVTVKEVEDLVRTKLLGYLKPADSKKATDSGNTTPTDPKNTADNGKTSTTNDKTKDSDTGGTN